MGWLFSRLAGQFIFWLVWLDSLVGLVRFVGSLVWLDLLVG